MRTAIRKLLTPRANRYLMQTGVRQLLATGDANEIPPDSLDLANLHRAVKRLRPRIILEFGVGFSTIVLAHALRQNGIGRLYSIDTDEQWIDNLRAKLPADLASIVDLQHTSARVALHQGELCHYYDHLPNVVPDLIYLDGPSGPSIKGEIRGLTFQPESTQVRQQAAADILLYESTLKTNATIIVDSRYNNVHFLARNLRRRWSIKINRLQRQSTFTLREHTGRQ